MLKFTIFDAFPNLIYAFSEKGDGSMYFFADSTESELEDREKFLKELFIPSGQVVAVQSEHSNIATLAGPTASGTSLPGTDALVTRETNIYLTATAADCFPIYLFDPHLSVAALAHAGWRGILAGLVTNTVKLMVEQGSKPQNILVGIGPGIQQHHFEIKNDVLGKFAGFEEFINKPGGKMFVDLPGIIRRQLLEQGIEQKNIEQSPECTYCLTDKYFSFRRDKPERVQPMLAVIGMK